MIGALLRWVWCIFGSMPEPKGLSRRLGRGECLMHDMNQQGSMITSSVVFISSIKPFTTSNIKWALERLMKTHPLLRMRIITHNGDLYWKEMDQWEPDLRVIDSGDWHAVFSDNTAEIFELENGPLWRVSYLPNVVSDYMDVKFEYHSAFVMSYTHAIIDAQGRMKLLNDFQDLLSLSLDCEGEDKTELEQSLAPPTSLKIAPSFEEFTTGTLGFWDNILLFLFSISFIKRLVLRRFTTSFLNAKHPFKQCVGEVCETDSTIEAKTCVFPMVLNTDDTALVLKACKMHKLSVHSAVQAAAVIAICEMIVEGAKERGIALEDITKNSVACTAGLRSALKPTTFDDVSYVVTLIYAIMDEVIISECADPMKFWQLATNTMNKIHTNKDGHIRMMHILQSLMTGQLSAFPHQRMNLLSFTNIGNCNYLNRDLDAKVKVTAHFSAAGEHTKGPVFANCITTLDKKMFWGAVYYPNITHRELAGRYLQRSISLLLHNCRQTVIGQTE